MKRFALAISMILASSALAPASLRPLNWVHHPKKAPAASQVRVEYHGTTAYSAEGRLYFPTAARTAHAAPARSKTRAQRSR
jgi:hypothetical protein